ncbi:hypothetical protein EJ06DRAFT_30437 [Trichodelitschia bisporula]|uniref:Uncharacterized protein n=1 Tax=Trichodelitschia bisporula TaxID=703511 RepID=A0A6G1IBL2_9PEZI|nr:hypothetical protein EJ06DRAFT_30437 [Trichodelitschia bisporula]
MCVPRCPTGRPHPSQFSPGSALRQTGLTLIACAGVEHWGVCEGCGHEKASRTQRSIAPHNQTPSAARPSRQETTSAPSKPPPLELFPLRPQYAPRACACASSRLTPRSSAPAAVRFSVPARRHPGDDSLGQQRGRCWDLTCPKCRCAVVSRCSTFYHLATRP